MSSKFLRSFIAGFLVFPFGLSGVGSVSATPVVSTASTKPAVVDSRPNEVSASITARVQGSRVEVSSARTDSTRLWANPDGSFSVDQYTGPNWVQQPDGSWNEIDATLISNGDSTFSPTETPMEVVVGSASAQSSEVQHGSVTRPATLATLTNLDQVSAAPDAASVSLGWAGDLPVPTVDGAVATYSDVNSNEDVRVKVLPTGVETFVDIKSRPIGLTSAGYSVNLPLAAKGLRIRDNADGTVDLINGSGEVVLETPAARVWDASVDPASGVSRHEISVNTELVKNAGGYALKVVVPSSYFDDSSDSPAWSVDSGLRWTRNFSDLTGGLSVITSGTASSTAATSTKTLTSSTMQLTDMHGDVVTTMDATAGANTPTSTSAFDEYGAMLNPPISTPSTYGWLGSQQRATTNVGLSLMGLRLYNPTTGRFLQTDPVQGGTPGPFVYPLDPISQLDLSGECLEDACILDAATVTISRSLISRLASKAAVIGVEEAGAAIVGEAESGVYVVLRNHSVRYVGQSVNISRRIGQHLKSGRGIIYSGERVIRIAVHGSKPERLKLEQGIMDRFGGSLTRNKLTELRNKINAIRGH